MLDFGRKSERPKEQFLVSAETENHQIADFRHFRPKIQKIRPKIDNFFGRKCHFPYFRPKTETIFGFGRSLVATYLQPLHVPTADAPAKRVHPGSG